MGMRALKVNRSVSYWRSINYWSDIKLLGTWDVRCWQTMSEEAWFLVLHMRDGDFGGTVPLDYSKNDNALV